jgi:hypothetical protein
MKLFEQKYVFPGIDITQIKMNSRT